MMQWTIIRFKSLYFRLKFKMLSSNINGIFLIYGTQYSVIMVLYRRSLWRLVAGCWWCWWRWRQWWLYLRMKVLDWIEQGLTSPSTQYRLSRRQFYRSKDPTNSIKVLTEKLASHRPEETPNPPGASHRVTSEPLKKKNPITVGRAQRDKAPHSRLACTSPV